MLVLIEGDDLTPNHQTVIVAWDLHDLWSSDAIWTYGTVLLEAPPDISGYRFVPFTRYQYHLTGFCQEPLNSYLDGAAIQKI